MCLTLTHQPHAPVPHKLLHADITRPPLPRPRAWRGWCAPPGLRTQGLCLPPPTSSSSRGVYSPLLALLALPPTACVHPHAHAPHSVHALKKHSGSGACWRGFIVTLPFKRVQSPSLPTPLHTHAYNAVNRVAAHLTVRCSPHFPLAKLGISPQLSPDSLPPPKSK